MGEFREYATALFDSLGSYTEMVLATSLNDKVSAQMTSFLIRRDWFYFRVDNTRRKYEQLRKNPNVALCSGDLQIEGLCREMGSLEDALFHQEYGAVFPRSVTVCSQPENERLFSIEPVWAQKWVFENGMPYTETFDFRKQEYRKSPYFSEP